jgi:transposase
VKPESLFEAALGVKSPWKVTKISFSVEQRRLDIGLDFERGGTFVCPECGAAGAKAYDTQEEEWRHLNFFQHETYLRARVPRVTCPNGCGVKKAEVPWARPGSGFTLLFEALIMALVGQMTVAAVARLVGEHDTRIWRVIHRHVAEARERLDFSAVTRVAVDETASRRGQNYVSLFFDSDSKQLMYGTEGRDKGTVRRFCEDLAAHQGDPARVRAVCCDMSPAFIAGVEASLPEARITFDRFHIMQLMGQAVDAVRREEVKETDVLKRTRYLWLKNPSGLTASQRATLDRLSRHHLKTARAYQIRLTLQDMFLQPDRAAGDAFLKRWYYWATHSRLEPVIDVAKTIKRHWDRVLNWFDSRLTMGYLEGINSLVQAAKAKARGYRTTKNLITMAYLLAGKLDFALPT